MTEIDALKEEHVRLTQQVEALREEITWKNKTLRHKNLALDALHYVWCSGGCDDGVCRFGHPDVTEEIVLEAERNTARLRRWFAIRQERQAVLEKRRGDLNQPIRVTRFWFSS